MVLINFFVEKDWNFIFYMQVFSMDGNVAPLPDIIGLAEKYEALTVGSADLFEYLMFCFYIFVIFCMLVS